MKGVCGIVIGKWNRGFGVCDNIKGMGNYFFLLFFEFFLWRLENLYLFGFYL